MSYRNTPPFSLEKTHLMYGKLVFFVNGYQDAIRVTIELMDAPKTDITVRTSYNLAGTSFSPAQTTETIQKIDPDFQTVYKPNYRQSIADTRPQSIDDSYAKRDWNCRPPYDLDLMTKDMFENLILKKECVK